MRRARAMPRVPFGPPKVPWIKPDKVLSGDPPDGEYEIPYGHVEARVENGVWTLVDKVSDGRDVGVGGASVWVLGKYTGVWQVGVETAQLIKLHATSTGGKQITASHAAPDFTKQETWTMASKKEATWTITSDSVLYVASDYAAIQVPALGFVDLSAADFDPPSEGALLDVFAVNLKGALFSLLSVFKSYAAGSKKAFLGYQWMPVNVGFPYPNAGFVRVALARKRSGKRDVWLIRNDDEVVNLLEPTVGKGPPSGGAWDIGAGGDALWAIGAVKPQDAGARGNVLWRRDLAAQKWDLISPGWGDAVDVDFDGNPWVLDSDGKLWVRGLRTLGVAYGARGAPKKGQTWPEYFSVPVQVALEGIAATREAGAGGTIALHLWDVPVGDLLVEWLVGPDPGFDVLFCLASIFSTAHRVPQSTLNKAPHDVEVSMASGEKKKVRFPDWAHANLQADYLAAVDKLASIGEFRERVRYFSIGNEVNLYLASLPVEAKQAQWDKYIKFCNVIAPEVKKRLPGARVGVSWTYEAIAGSSSVWQDMSKECDVLIATLYARDAGDQPLEPVDYKGLFPGPVLKMAEAAGKPLVLQEVGMPTPRLYDTTTKIESQKSFYLASQLKQQAEFLDYVFQQWQLAGGRIRFLSWWPLYDYFYDPNLEVELDPADPNAIRVKTSSSGVPKEDPNNGKPFIGLGNALAGAFFGPDWSGKNPENLGKWTPEDLVHFLNQSANGGEYQSFCQFLSSCGLLQTDGTKKPAWFKYREWADKLGVQKVP